jgi:hypothetical protein
MKNNFGKEPYKEYHNRPRNGNSSLESWANKDAQVVTVVLLANCNV